jgi:hypothetical protein
MYMHACIHTVVFLCVYVNILAHTLAGILNTVSLVWCSHRIQCPLVFFRGANAFLGHRHVWSCVNCMEFHGSSIFCCPGLPRPFIGAHKKLFSFWVGTCCDQFRGTVFEATPLALWMLCCCIVYASTIRKSDSQIGYTWIYNYIYTCTYNAAMERDTMPVIHSVCGIHNGRSATTMCFCVSLVCLCQIFPQLMPHVYIYNYIYIRVHFDSWGRLQKPSRVTAAVQDVLCSLCRPYSIGVLRTRCCFFDAWFYVTH